MEPGVQCVQCVCVNCEGMDVIGQNGVSRQVSRELRCKDIIRGGGSIDRGGG